MRRTEFWSSQLAEHRGVVTPMIGPAHTGIHLLGVLVAAFGGGWLFYHVAVAMLESDLWQKSLLLGSVGLVPLLVGFLLVSRR